jgi:hypothetical protein
MNKLLQKQQERMRILCLDNADIIPQLEDNLLRDINGNAMEIYEDLVIEIGKEILSDEYSLEEREIFLKVLQIIKTKKNEQL